jgi:membrane protein
MTALLHRAVYALRQVIDQVVRDDVAGLAAEMSYRFFMAIFPFAIFLTAFGGFVAQQLAVSNPAARIVQALSGVLPPDAATLVQSQLEQIISGQNATLLSAGALLALWFATGGMNAIIKALNRAYNVPEGRVTWHRYVVAIVLTLVGGATVIAAFVLFVPVRLIASEVVSTLGFGQFAQLAVNATSGAAALLLLIAAAAFIYRVAPNIKLPPGAVLPGAVVFAVSWLAITFGFAFYVSNFGNYANTYGALAGVVIMLIWFYLSSILLLVSAEINEVVHQIRKPGEIDRLREESRRLPKAPRPADDEAPAGASAQPEGPSAAEGQAQSE